MKSTVAGRTYLALQKKARADGRPTDELLQLLALETFVDRMSTSPAAKDLVLKGGVLLAAYDMRRPTRDVDVSARGLSNSVQATTELVRTILGQERDDGWTFGAMSGESIREEDEYSGVRVAVAGELATARITFHVDVNFGDPISPGPAQVAVPRLLGGSISVRGYPLAMVHAEKIVTAVQRGIANTRWRDYADIYLLSGRHAVSAMELSTAIATVAAHRQADMTLLSEALDGFAPLAQARWSAWVRRQRMQDRLPLEFAELLAAVMAFADPLVGGNAGAKQWTPATRAWV
jgi:hypothetical protein